MENKNITKNTENTIITLNDLINQQVTTGGRGGKYVNYTSKKALMDAKVLTTTQADVIGKLKNCFSFSLHNNKQWLVITMYYSNNKTYSYLAVNLDTLAVTTYSKIAEAKKYIDTQIVVK